MRKIYLLTREMSAYSYDTPMLLGVFTQKKLAENAKQRYLQQMANFDPFHDQAYFTVDFANDVKIVPTDDSFYHNIGNTDSKTVYLVAQTEEGFGQTYQDFVAIFDNKKYAQDFADHENELIDSNSFPKFFDTLTLPLNQLIHWFIRNNQLAESLYFNTIVLENFEDEASKIFCHEKLLNPEFKQLLVNAYEGEDGFYIDRHDGYLTAIDDCLVLKNHEQDFAHFKINLWDSSKRKQKELAKLMQDEFCLLIVFYEDIATFNIENWIAISDDELKNRYQQQQDFDIFVLNVV